MSRATLPALPKMRRAPTANSRPHMNTGSAIVAGAGTRDPRAGRKSRWPARLDWMQSASGLVLALFMWGHMFFVSSILLGKDAMWTRDPVLRGLLSLRAVLSLDRLGRRRRA